MSIQRNSNIFSPLFPASSLPTLANADNLLHFLLRVLEGDDNKACLVTVVQPSQHDTLNVLQMS